MLQMLQLIIHFFNLSSITLLSLLPLQSVLQKRKVWHVEAHYPLNCAVEDSIIFDASRN